jgi:hypothetical protein
MRILPACVAPAKNYYYICVSIVAQWSSGQWVTKIYYLELLRASEGTLSHWSRLNLQSLASAPVSRKVDVRQAAVEIFAEYS